MVVSFSPHPRITLGRSEGLTLLSSESEKIKLLEAAGVETLILLPFDKRLSELSYEEFVVEYLIRKIGMRELVIGFNHHLGRNGGSSSELIALAAKHNFCATTTEEFGERGENISSSTIRHLIANGQIKAANRALGESYLILAAIGKEGRIELDEALKLLPKAGRYKASIGGIEHEIEVESSGVAWCKHPQCAQVEIRLISEL